MSGRWRRLDRGADGWASFAGRRGGARCFMQSRPVRISGVLRTCGDRRAHHLERVGEDGSQAEPITGRFGNPSRVPIVTKSKAMAGGGHDHAARESAGARCARRWVAWSLRRAPLLALAALVLMVPATWLTVRLYRNLSSDVEELLPRQAPSVLATDELRARVPGLSTLGVVVDAGRPDRVPAAERLLDDLA